MSHARPADQSCCPTARAITYRPVQERRRRQKKKKEEGGREERREEEEEVEERREESREKEEDDERIKHKTPSRSCTGPAQPHHEPAASSSTPSLFYTREDIQHMCFYE